MMVRSVEGCYELARVFCIARHGKTRRNRIWLAADLIASTHNLVRGNEEKRAMVVWGAHFARHGCLKMCVGRGVGVSPRT